MKTYWVYILANKNRRLYIGLNSDLEGRLWQHRNGVRSRFASRYSMSELVYVEDYSSANDAIARERQLTRWRRDKKVALIERQNPEWRDLSADWYE